MEHRQKAICLFLGISLFFAGGVLHLCRQHPSKFINEKRTHVGAVRRFRLGEDTFFLDGKPLQIVSGSIHYFRIHPEYWRDRLMRVKALGLNTIQFYVPWNFHEQKRGNVRFDGWQDFPKFCRIAQEVGLLVMLRLGPYVCGEWEFGGFPEWLLTENVELRSSDPAYLRLVDEWWDHLLPEVVPLLYKNGGPIIMVQVENEFGAYRPSKNESQYLKHLVNRAKAALGNDVVIYTTDQPPSITFGSLPGGSVYSAVDFGMYQDSAAAFKIQKDFNAPGPSPPMNTEYYTGWFTCWKDPISITDFSILAKGLIGVFKMNASVSFYMAHGGTNFGYWSGAYGSETKFATDITSYDYDAPIREDGDLRQPKFDVLREVIAHFTGVTNIYPRPPPIPRKAYGKVQLEVKAALLDCASQLASGGPILHSPIKTMDDVQQRFGFILYRTQLSAAMDNGKILIEIGRVHDRAQVYVEPVKNGGDHRGIVEPLLVNGNRSMELCQKRRLVLGTIQRPEKEVTLFVPLNVPQYSDGLILNILVENQGRINYGYPDMYDKKGLLGGVAINKTLIDDWTIYRLPLENVTSASLDEARCSAGHLDGKVGDRMCEQERKSHFNLEQCITGQVAGPTFYSASFIISDKPKDTYLALRSWSKGVAYINGFNLGRYWPTAGPQCNLYIPSPVLKTGKNDLVIFELDIAPKELVVEFTDEPDFTCGHRSLLRAKARESSDQTADVTI